MTLFLARAKSSLGVLDDFLIKPWRRIILFLTTQSQINMPILVHFVNIFMSLFFLLNDFIKLAIPDQI
jgi:hypothetical protein